MTRSQKCDKPGTVPRHGLPAAGAEPAGITESEALDLHAHAQALQAAERHAEALAAFEAAGTYFAAADGPQSPDLANMLADSAESLMALCRYTEAEAKARHAKQILESVKDLLDPAMRGLLVPRAYGILGWSSAFRTTS